MRVWVASLLFYGAIFTLCEALRWLIEWAYRKQAKNCQALDARAILLEMIGTVQVCAPMFDVNAVMEHYGLVGVAAEILFIECVNATLMRDALADPCSLFGTYLKGRFSARNVALLLAAQLAAGYAAYLLARAFWQLRTDSVHAEMLHAACSSDLTVTMLYGSAVEAGGLLVLRAFEHFYASSSSDDDGEDNSRSLRGVTLACAATSSLVTVLGIELTGMYANPVVAWACTFNCGETTAVAHFVVYWVAPMVAWLVADRFLADDDTYVSADKALKVD